MNLIRKNLSEIVSLCQKHKVQSLYAFGSILTPRFGDDSDVDFSVTFDRSALTLDNYGDNYFDLKFSLEKLLGRDVDLVEYSAVRNPYFKEELDNTKQLVYGNPS